MDIRRRKIYNPMHGKQDLEKKAPKTAFETRLTFRGKTKF